MQMKTSQLYQVALTMQHEMHKNAAALEGILTRTQKKKVEMFAQDQSKYAPQSGEIFGILKSMLESFETNLANSQKDESKGIEDYTALKASKEKRLLQAKNRLRPKLRNLRTLMRSWPMTNKTLMTRRPACLQMRSSSSISKRHVP